MRRILFTFTIALVMLAAFPALSQDLQRGLKNYEEILNRNKTLEQLSAQEQQEVFAVLKLLKKKQITDNKSPDCQDAVSSAESKSSELANYARRLKNCAENQDYHDDCNTEFRRVKNSYNDYESAVSSVKEYCE